MTTIGDNRFESCILPMENAEQINSLSYLLTDSVRVRCTCQYKRPLFDRNVTFLRNGGRCVRYMNLEIKSAILSVYYLT